MSKPTYVRVIGEVDDEAVHVVHPTRGTTLLTCCGYCDVNHEIVEGPASCHSCQEVIRDMKALRGVKFAEEQP